MDLNYYFFKATGYDEVTFLTTLTAIGITLNVCVYFSLVLNFPYDGTCEFKIQ